MKKRITKLMALLLTTSMLVPMTACSTSKKSASDEHVLNIWCWNDEFQSRFNDYYPEVKKVSKDKSGENTDGSSNGPNEDAKSGT